MRASPRLATQRNAIRFLLEDDKEALQVLADQANEEGWTAIRTGRVRAAYLYLVRLRSRIVNPEVLTPAELRSLATWVTDWLPVQAKEHIYNVEGYRFTREAKERAKQFEKIFVMWTTSKRDIYRSLVRKGKLPRTIRFHEIVWESVITDQQEWSGTSLAFRLYIERRKPRSRSKKLLRHYLMDITRRDKESLSISERRTDTYYPWIRKPAERDVTSRRSPYDERTRTRAPASRRRTSSGLAQKPSGSTRRTRAKGQRQR